MHKIAAMAKQTLSGQEYLGRGWRTNESRAMRLTKAICILLLVLALCQSTAASPATCDPDAAATYTAAVVEYSPALGVTEENAAERFQENLDAYKNYIGTAKKEGADIVVFPECGLATLELPLLADGAPAVSVDVSNIGSNPCIEKDITHSKEMRDLSCAAREAGIYVVVNLPERESCSPVLSFCPECPGFDAKQIPSAVLPCSINGFRFFNTNLAFDRKGTLVARYRKYNLFGEAGFVAPVTAEHATFETDFGVRFGMFTCFDLMFEKPAVELVADLGVFDIIFPTAWFSELPFLTAVQAQSAWAWVLDVNLLAAGYNLPVVGSTGTGLYAGRHGTVTATMERSRVSKMLLGQLRNVRSCKATGLAEHVTLSGRKVTLQGGRSDSEPPAFTRKRPTPTTMDCIRELPPRKVTIPSLYKCHLKSLLQMKEGRRMVRADTGEASYDDNADSQQKERDHNIPFKGEASSSDEEEEELRLDQTELGEVMAPYPDADARLIQGHDYRQFIQDSMIRGMARLQHKNKKKSDHSDDYHFVGHSNVNGGNMRNINFKYSKNPGENSNGDKKHNKKQDMENIAEEENEEAPTLEETARIMISGMKDIGTGIAGEQLTNVVEGVKEEEEKAKLAAMRQPSIDEMESILLGALRESSGNMTAETEIFDEVMLDVHEAEQREAEEKKFVLERCQTILAEMAEEDSDDSVDQDVEETEGLPVLHDIDDVNKQLDDPNQTNNVNLDERQVEESTEAALAANEYTADADTQDTSVSESDGTSTNEETAATMDNDGSRQMGEEPADSQEIPFQGVAEEVLDDSPIIEEVPDTNVETSSSEQEVIPDISAVENNVESVSQDTEEAPQIRESPIVDESHKTQRDIQTPTMKTKRTPTPNNQQDPIFEVDKSSEEYLYLKTEDLSKYATLLLTSDILMENSTLNVCHGIFCCHFTVALNVKDLQNLESGVNAESETGDHLRFSKSDQGSYAYDMEKFVNEKVHDDLQSFVQLDRRFNLGRSYLVEHEESEEEEDEDDDDDENENDIEMSEMEPEEYDDDDDYGEEAEELDEGPVFLQTSVLQQMQVGDPLPGSGTLTMEDMEPSEKIIEEEKRVKEREQKAISEGTMEDSPVPTIPGGDKSEEKQPSALEKEHKEEIETKEVPETVEKHEAIDRTEEDHSKETIEGAGEADVGELGPTEGEPTEGEPTEDEPAVVEEVPDISKCKVTEGKRICTCEECDQKIFVEEEGDREATNIELEGHTLEKASERNEPPKRYYYRVAVFNGLRSFDGVTDGGLQVCAVISCTDTSVESCGKIHGDQTRLIPTSFQQVTISGRFRKKQALPMPSTLSFDMLPVPAKAFSLKVTPQKGDEADVTMKTHEETTFLTFGIYSRNFEQDPPRLTSIR